MPGSGQDSLIPVPDGARNISTAHCNQHPVESSPSQPSAELNYAQPPSLAAALLMSTVPAPIVRLRFVRTAPPGAKAEAPTGVGESPNHR